MTFIADQCCFILDDCSDEWEKNKIYVIFVYVLGFPEYLVTVMQSLQQYRILLYVGACTFEHCRAFMELFSNS
jgi:hypothetical protein